MTLNPVLSAELHIIITYVTMHTMQLKTVEARPSRITWTKQEQLTKREINIRVL
jgi:hypothetical protein